MKDELALSTPTLELKQSEAGLSLLDSLGRRALLTQLAKLRLGRLHLVEQGRCHSFGREGTGPQATLFVRDPSVYRSVLLGGTVGAAEAYMDGAWRSDDLVSVIRIFAINDEMHGDFEGGGVVVRKAAESLRYLLDRNTRTGSRRNIRRHYDLGNDFFKLFLDETMTYSAGIFETPSSTLREASEAKLDRLCRKLDLGPDDHLLEIGSGWGGFAIHAAGRYGCRVTTTTISEEQHSEARRRVQEAGLADRVEVQLTDYRDLRGQFDKLVSIEMIEAVGHEFLPTYFAKVSSLLKPQGLAAIQAITLPDHGYARMRRTVDFIKKHVFPGSQVPSLQAMSAAWSSASDLSLVNLEDISIDYARTLRAWRENFHRNQEAIRSLGYDDRFLRMWDYYLAYCEGSFWERYTGTVQLLLARPGFRGQSALPKLDAGTQR